ncbi:MAG: glycosyltransferase family 39 protein [Lentisphaeraceae bacterium]|nr:glycosyltransferase family 39 protein [Lentisphaeraceae bacterium]
MYTENELNKSWKWMLFLVSAMLLLPQLAMKELTSSEAAYGMMSRHAFYSGNIFSTVTQGVLIEEGHLFPWLVNLCGMLGVNEFTVRLPSVMALTIMIISASFVTYRYGSRQSAIVSGMCMLSTVAAVKMGTRGEENMLSAAFISLAWLVWFEYSRKHKKWFYAWFYGLCITSFAAFCSGYYAFIIFYLPLFFLRRPTDVRRRIFHNPHFKALVTIISLHFIIYLIAINITANRDQSLNLGLNLALQDYESENFLNFPFTALYLLLPWTFFSWPAFCAAFQPMEKDHILFHYLRTISVSLFIVFWLLPGSSPIFLLPVLVPIAIMTGLHYQILVRRHHIPIRKLVRFTYAIILIVNIGWLIFFGLNIFGTFDLNISKNWIYLNSGIAVLAILLAIFILLKGREYPVWLKIMCMVVLGHWSIITFNSLPQEGTVTNKVIGRSLTTEVPEEATVYNFTGDLNSQIMFYTNRRVLLANKDLDPEKEELPKTIYVITGENKPTTLTIDPAYYKWQTLSETISGEKGTYQAWIGIHRAP